MPLTSNVEKSSSNQFVYTVSELNQDVRTLLENGFSQLWLEGEISNFACPSSGHWYFSLKDQRAQVRCAMFKNKNRSTGFTPQQGDKVLVKARISLYEARGEYQILVDEMEEAGSGALQRAFEALKKKLNSEGLFDKAIKKPLPEIPKQIGIITSPTGAAVKDVLSVLKRRFPSIPVLIYPVTVQGDSAAQQIADGIALMDKSELCDVIILTRGGGSLEDLWSFNDEIVARKIFHSNTPIVSAVGHEIDFTIADFVADLRAPTPSAAAELVTPDINEILNQVDYHGQRMSLAIQKQISENSKKLIDLSQRLKHPSRQLTETTQQLDDLEMRLRTAFQHRIKYKIADLQQTHLKLMRNNPLNKITNYQWQVNNLISRLNASAKLSVSNGKQKWKSLSHSLNLVSPLATLDRGYAIVKQRNNPCIIRSYSEVKPNDKIEVRIADGQLHCTVDEAKK